MNFKTTILTFFIFSLFIGGCGVKGPPIYPKGTEIPAWQSSYFPKIVEDEAPSTNKKPQATPTPKRP